MNLILNEKEIVDKALKEGYIDQNKPSKTVIMLTKYYLGEGKTKKETFDLIDKFMSKNYKNYKFINWQSKINKEINKTYKKGDFELFQLDNIIIYHEELVVIKNINDLKLEKLAFALLVYAKIYNKINGNNTNWVNSELKYVFSDAKIYINIKNQMLMINKLVNLDLIRVSRKVDCTNIIVLFARNNGNIAFKIDNFQNIIYYYLKLFNPKRFKECKECGALIKITSNHIMYCRNCWKEIRLEQQREWDKNKRIK